MNMASSSSPRPHVRRLLALSMVLLCIASAIMTSARSGPVSAAARQAPTTPALLDQAFARGEISSDQRLLYLIYAIYDFGKLPTQFHGRPGWSATMAVREINHARQALASGRASFSAELRAALQAPSLQAATVCNTQDGPNSINTAHFHIVYGTIVGLTAQDYANAIEGTFATEITSLGWA